MPNIKSAKKRVLVNKRQKAENRLVKAALSTEIKKFRKALAEGDLCVNGKTKTFYIHLELSNDDNYPGVKMITIRNSYYIINTIGEDLYVKNSDGNIIMLEKNDSNIPIPLILAK